MKKTILSIIAAAVLSTSLAAQTYKENNVIDEVHQVFVSKTKNIPLNNATKEFIFFGTMEDLQEIYVNTQKTIREKGLDGALKGLEHSTNAIAKGFLESAAKGIGAGIAFGIVLGLADPYIMAMYADEEYVLIYDYTTPSGEKTRINAVFVASDFDNEDVIKKYLEDKINEVK